MVYCLKGRQGPEGQKGEKGLVGPHGPRVNMIFHNYIYYYVLVIIIN